MSAESDRKWAAAIAELPGDQQNQLKMLKADYELATKLHTKYPGGPNAGILSELIKMGWRKP